jgi:hypothetical protein
MSQLAVAIIATKSNAVAHRLARAADVAQAGQCSETLPESQFAPQIIHGAERVHNLPESAGYSRRGNRP